jgi:hypothetical protein
MDPRALHLNHMIKLTSNQWWRSPTSVLFCRKLVKGSGVNQGVRRPRGSVDPPLTAGTTPSYGVLVGAILRGFTPCAATVMSVCRVMDPSIHMTSS